MCHNMPCYYPLTEEKSKIPATLIKEYVMEGITDNGEVKTIKVENNHQRFVMHNIDWVVKRIRFIPISTYGAGEFRVFGFEIS